MRILVPDFVYMCDQWSLLPIAVIRTDDPSGGIIFQDTANLCPKDIMDLRLCHFSLPDEKGQPILYAEQDAPFYT